MPVQENLVDRVWGADRPPRPNELVKVLGVEFAGKKFEGKLEDLRKELEKKKSAAFIVCRYMPPTGWDHVLSMHTTWAGRDETD